jgi:hypothetical protein
MGSTPNLRVASRKFVTTPVILSEVAGVGVSVRISKYEKHGLCHGFRI